MTAEIAILNKTAVALAADSAVTIGAGDEQTKIFDSADKLFELSDKDPIGVMIYNGGSFMEAPLPSLIREFRTICPKAQSVREAADAFLHFLNDFGRKTSQDIRDAGIKRMVVPMMQLIQDNILDRAMNSP